LPPPRSVIANIPKFHLHGWENCGNHRYDTTHGHLARMLARNGRRDGRVWTLPCGDCGIRVALNELHDLPCGHMLCRECLLVAGLRVGMKIEMNHVRIREARLEMQEIDRRLYLEPRMGPLQKDMLQRRYSLLRRTVLDLAALTCCGHNTKLDRLLPCMTPVISRDLWLAINWICQSPDSQRSCAWPDCGAYLPACCRYRTVDANRWYCVTCHGNSMDCSRVLPASQTKFPFLPRGQPALTPAR
jgi:hypothetical protein